jgi:plastocyanin
MRSERPSRPFAVAMLLCLVLAPAGRAGQVHVDVRSRTFDPPTILLNQGDQVVWVWHADRHTVTHTTPPPPIFDSGPLFYNSTSGTAFTWKSDRTGSIPYHCTPHLLDGHVGTLTISASGVDVADFRITEVQYTATGGLDLIEISNLGAAAGDLGRYRIAPSNGSTVTVPVDSFLVRPGDRVTVHANASGTSVEPTDLYLPSLPDLPTSGSLALYVPNTAPSTSLNDSTQIVDFVQWGAGGQSREATAVAAGYWSAGQFIPTVGVPAHSIEFCGGPADRGRLNWEEISSPNFGSNGNCSTTPTLPTTWGRLKSLYR